MSESDGWKLRLKEEHRELAARISRLEDEIGRLVFDTTMERLSRLWESDSESDDESARSRQLELLSAQERAMKLYKFILEERARLAGIQL